ncbi:MAG: GNAT family N-acetyltransferase [Burkholderiales bacterium]|nr:GNAT family N-acetyltransferase [Burkholderiales bacterium]
MTIAYETHDDAPEDAARVVDTGLGEANKLAAPVAGVRQLCAFARDVGGRVIGGAVGRTWGDCCELQQLWVAPRCRRQGVGSELVRRFEGRGRERGCRTFYLFTFSFQAPPFYCALGYRPAHEIRGYPSGIVQYLMMRTDLA